MSRDTFDIKGADGKTLVIPKSEWYIDTKARAKRAMRSPCFSPPARIHICLGLHTMGFRQELAVKMEGGKQVPLTPSDVCAETSLPLKHFRQHMACLERYGLGKCEGSTKGRVSLYGWGVPRDVDVKKIVPAPGTIPTFFPPEIQSLFKRYHIRFPDGFVPAPGEKKEIERLGQGTIEAVSSLRQYVNGLRARPGLNKEERNGKEPIERNGGDPPPPFDAVSTADEEPYPVFKSLYPKEHFDEPKAKPLFLGMKPARQHLALARLPVYLESERWQKSPLYIPLASNWLKSDFTADPPPYLPEPAKRKSKTEKLLEEAFGAASGE